MLNIALIIQLFVLLNPFASFPFLISAYQKKLDMKMVAVKAVLTAFAIAVIMALIGPTLFSIFGITLNSFRIAGGLVLFLLGLHMVRPNEEVHKKEITNIDSLTTIIATPMLTGPGTISFITIKTLEVGKLAILSNIAGAFVLVGAVFSLFSLLVSKVNPKIVNIVSRIMGLFLMAVAVDMIANGAGGMVSLLLQK